MKKLITLLACAVSLTTTAAPFPSIVTCIISAKGKTEKIQFRMGANRKIVAWDDKKLAKGNRDSDFFGMFTNDTENYGVEYWHATIAKNGYSLLEAGSTADEIIVGISPDFTNGFYRYRDHGSGNGNYEYSMVCSPQ